jgi:hypothetical protein
MFPAELWGSSRNWGSSTSQVSACLLKSNNCSHLSESRAYSNTSAQRFHTSDDRTKQLAESTFWLWACYFDMDSVYSSAYVRPELQPLWCTHQRILRDCNVSHSLKVTLWGKTCLLYTPERANKVEWDRVNGEATKSVPTQKLLSTAAAQNHGSAPPYWQITWERSSSCGKTSFSVISKHAFLHCFSCVKKNELFISVFVSHIRRLFLTLSSGLQVTKHRSFTISDTWNGASSENTSMIRQLTSAFIFFFQSTKFVSNHV